MICPCRWRSSCSTITRLSGRACAHCSRRLTTSRWWAKPEPWPTHWLASRRPDPTWPFSTCDCRTGAASRSAARCVRPPLDTFRRAGAGESLLDPSLTDRVLARLAEGPTIDPRLASLTPQERRILDLIAQGKTNREIGAEMFLAEKTVKNYVSNLLSKLGMQRRTQAATFVARLNERTSADARSDATGT